MKLMKFGLRVWIALSAVVGFMAGWVVVAHNGPTAALSATQQSAVNTAAGQSAPALTSPLGSTNVSGSQSQSAISSPAQTFSRSTPRLRTGGS